MYKSSRSINASNQEYLFFFTCDFSYLYYFNTNDWSAVYKHTARKDLKFKAGYDSSVDGGLKWACVWVCLAFTVLPPPPFMFLL